MVQEGTEIAKRGGSGRLPNFLIIGAQRSGTTFLARMLGAHPDVFVARQKELHFFDAHFDRGVSWYQRQFAVANGARAVGEATQTYLYVDTASQRMASVVPDAKLIAILRNPVDRAYSHYWQSRARGREPLSFGEAVAAESSRLETRGTKYATMHAYVARGYYADQLERVTTLYPRSRLHVLLFDDLRDGRDVVLADLFDFLGVRPDVDLQHVSAARNEYVSYRIPALRRVQRRFPRPIRRAVRRLNARSASYPALDPKMRARLTEHYAPHNARLAAWLGRDLSAWGS